MPVVGADEIMARAVEAEAEAEEAAQNDSSSSVERNAGVESSGGPQLLAFGA